MDPKPSTELFWIIFNTFLNMQGLSLELELIPGPLANKVSFNQTMVQYEGSPDFMPSYRIHLTCHIAPCGKWLWSDINH